MRYAPDFEQIELGEEKPLVIHRHGAELRSALIIFDRSKLAVSHSAA